MGFRWRKKETDILGYYAHLRRHDRIESRHRPDQTVCPRSVNMTGALVGNVEAAPPFYVSSVTRMVGGAPPGFVLNRRGSGFRIVHRICLMRLRATRASMGRRGCCLLTQEGMITVAGNRT